MPGFFLGAAQQGSVDGGGHLKVTANPPPPFLPGWAERNGPQPKPWHSSCLGLVDCSQSKDGQEMMD